MCSLSLAQRAPGAAPSGAGTGSLPDQSASTACDMLQGHQCHQLLPQQECCTCQHHLLPVLSPLPSTVLCLAAARETEAPTLSCCWPQLSHQPAQAFLWCFPLLFLLSTQEFSRFLCGVCGAQTTNELTLGLSTLQVMGLCSCMVPSVPWLSCPCSFLSKDKPRAQPFSWE